MKKIKFRSDLSRKEKLEILERYDKLPKMSQRSAAVHLKISQPLLCKLLKNRDQIEDALRQNENLNSKRNRGGKDDEVEKALKLWFTIVREQNERVSGPLMKQKAEELAQKMGKNDFVATDGWFYRWKKRENIVYKRTHGEEKDADFSSAEAWFKNEWPKIISEFSPRDIYNAVETGLFYRALPERTYLLKNENAKGCKKSRERVTVLCCVNMQGEKERLLVIGESPSCFKGIRKLPVHYYSNCNAWMTTLIFNEWLVKWDKRLDRKIILLIDKCTTHVINSSLTHIKLVFLPANTTSCIQPCNKGIIRTLKAYYRREMRSRILDKMEDLNKLTANELAKKTSLLDALHLLAMSWEKISADTIKNCFRHCGFSEREEETDETHEENLKPSDMTKTEFEAWMAIDDKISVAPQLTDDEICMLSCSTSLQSDNEDEFDEDETLKPPTNKEMRDALEVLRRGVLAKSDNFTKQYEYEHFINDLLRKNSRQTTIIEYFKYT